MTTQIPSFWLIWRKGTRQLWCPTLCGTRHVPTSCINFELDAHIEYLDSMFYLANDKSLSVYQLSVNPEEVGAQESRAEATLVGTAEPGLTIHGMAEIGQKVVVAFETFDAQLDFNSVLVDSKAA